MRMLTLDNCEKFFLDQAGIYLTGFNNTSIMWGVLQDTVYRCQNAAVIHTIVQIGYNIAECHGVYNMMADIESFAMVKAINLRTYVPTLEEVSS